jgi:L-lactate dehydrogenase complex protein LldG
VSSQEAFLARVRRALRKERGPAALHPPLLGADPDPYAALARMQVRLLQQRAELVAQLQQELTAVGGVVAQVASVAEGTQYIARAAQQKQASRRQELRALLARAEVGLSGVDYVIAETGTLVVSARHCLLLRAEGAELPQHLTSCVSFITGPSRTGDIELTLTVGVHGPGELHLVLVDSTLSDVVPTDMDRGPSWVTGLGDGTGASVLSLLREA